MTPLTRTLQNLMACVYQLAHKIPALVLEFLSDLALPLSLSPSIY